MRKVREVLRLYFGAGLSARKVARSCSIARSTVGEYIQRAENAGLGWPLPEGMDDAQLESALFKRPHYSYSTKRPQPDMHYLHTEMRRKSVTLQLLWDEYKQVHPDGYEYSQFCEHYRRYKQKLDLVLAAGTPRWRKDVRGLGGPDCPHRGSAHRGDHLRQHLRGCAGGQQLHLR